MTFTIVGLILWGYVLLGGITHPGHMLGLTIILPMVVIFIWLKCGGKPGKTAHNIFGQIIFAGIINSLIMLTLGRGGVFLGIPANILFMCAVIYTRAARLVQRPHTAYERGYHDGASQR